MNQLVVLDAGPLGLITNPRKSSDSIAATEWSISLIEAGHRFFVPAVADYEVRRELIRAGRSKGIAQLNAFNTAYADRFLPLSQEALFLAAALWAQSRNAGKPTGDPKELDCDVIIAAQALTLAVPSSNVIVATTNARHLSQFVTAHLWSSIPP